MKFKGVSLSRQENKYFAEINSIVIHIFPVGWITVKLGIMVGLLHLGKIARICGFVGRWVLTTDTRVDGQSAYSAR